MVEDETTIRVKIKTRNRLAEIGNKDDSFDTLINLLLDEHEKVKK